MALDNKNIKGADALIKKLQQAKAYLQNDVPEVIGTEAVKHFKQNFVNEGFDNEKWKPRKLKTSLSRKVLTGQSNGEHLGESIDYKVAGNTITIYTDKVYAEIHNEGGTITVTPKMKSFFWAMAYQAKEAGDTDLQEAYTAMALSKSITIEQRKFIGESPLLKQKIVDKIKRDLKKLLQ